LLIGFTRDESGNELRFARSVEEFKAAANKYFGAQTEAFLKLYPVRSDADVPTMGATAVRDGGMATSIRSWALGQVAKGQAPAYIYMYSHPHSYEPGAVIADLNPTTAGAYHTSEVPYFLLTQDVYNRLRKTRAWTQYDRQLANTMSDVLVAFATSGAPETTEVRVPKFTIRKQEYVEFGDRIATGRFNVARMDFFSTVNMPGAVGPSSRPQSPRD